MSSFCYLGTWKYVMVRRVRRPPRILCPLPWLHRYVNPDGTVHVCCTAVNGAVLRADGRPFHIGEVSSEEEIVNSRHMREVKSQMMRGEWPALCARCQNDERLGAVSRRQHELRAFGQEFAALVSRTADDGTSPVATSFFDYRLGNTCNLKCRMCHPLFSTRWMQEYRLVDAAYSAKDYMHFDWYRREEAWRPLFQQLPYVEYLHFAGGEPLIIPQMLGVLQRIVDAGESHHIVLNYNTNLTKIPEVLRELWPQFKEVHLYCSIDGFGRVNEYIRNPSLWSEIDANLRHLDDAFEAYGLTEIAINCTVQVYNVLRLGELFDYLAQTFRHVRAIPALSPLDQPPYFDVRILPASLKRLAIERLEGAKLTHVNAAWKINPVMVRKVDEIIRLLGEEMAGVDRLRAEFRYITRALDTHRGENLLAVVPELEPLMDPGESKPGLASSLAVLGLR